MPDHICYAMHTVNCMTTFMYIIPTCIEEWRNEMKPQQVRATPGQQGNC